MNKVTVEGGLQPRKCYGLGDYFCELPGSTSECRLEIVNVEKWHGWFLCDQNRAGNYVMGMCIESPIQ